MSQTRSILKVFQGPATRQQMFTLFDRHARRPTRGRDDAAALYAGEWFEILPPLWMRGSTFAMREFMTGSVASVFFALRIDGAIRHFHGYCDLSDHGFVDAMWPAIIERESRPVPAMSRNERLEHIWSTTTDDYRGMQATAGLQHCGGSEPSRYGAVSTGQS